MILGIGSDLVDIRRIELALTRFGARFEERLFTPGERRKAQARAHKAATYAKRFAAKEACAKALGTGMRQGVFWRDMEVVNLSTGAPTLRLSNGALARLQVLVPAGHAPRLHLTMSDEAPYAQAQVIISAEPDKE